jgi:hypothetical protein
MTFSMTKNHRICTAKKSVAFFKTVLKVAGVTPLGRCYTFLRYLIRIVDPYPKFTVENTSGILLARWQKKEEHGGQKRML